MTTTRETADHAELARMAEAAAPYWHAANLACGGNPIAVDLVAPFVGAMSPTVCSSLLSEIAALRGEVASLEIRRDFFKHNMTQAERQRDDLRKALEDHDQTAAECRIDGVRPQRDTTAPCELCGATQRESCGRKGSAAYAFISTARTLIANQGADQ